MVITPCLVLYGNSVFLAGIKAELERSSSFELISIESGRLDVADLIYEKGPCAVIFDFTLEQPYFAVSLLRRLPGLLLIGVDPCSDEMLVLSCHPVQALSVADLIEVICQKDSKFETFNGGAS